MPEPFDAYYKWLGIRPEEQPPNHYRLLGVAPFESDPDVLANAADQRMAHLRNFQSGPHRDICAELLNHVAAARVCLLNPRNKQAYDVHLRESLTAQTPKPPPVPDSGPKVPPVMSTMPRVGETKLVSDRRFARGRRDWVIRTVSAVGAVVIFLAATLAWMYWNRNNSVLPPDNSDASLAQLPPEEPPTPALSGPSATSPSDERQSLPDAPAKPSDAIGPISEKSSHEPGPQLFGPSELESKPASEMASDPPPEPELEPSSAPAPNATPTHESTANQELDPAAESSGQPNPVIVLTPPDTRAPVPTDAALAAAYDAVREVYDADYKAARNREQKRELADRLLQKAEQTRNDLPVMMTLLKLVMQVAEQADDCARQLQAIEILAATFQVDGLQMKAEALRKYSAKADSSIERDWVVQQATRLIDRALVVDRFDMAAEFARLSSDSTGTATEMAGGPVHDRAAEIDEARQSFEGAQLAVATLATNGSDEEASLALGKYLCLVKGDWERGLSWLAKGSDPVLKELAAQEQVGANSPETQVRLGDSWWDLSEKAAGTVKKQLRERAAFRYRQALPTLTGLPRDRAAKRLAAMATEMRLSLASPKAINQFFLAPGPGKLWKTTRGALHIRGDMTYTIFNTYFKSISSVTIVGGIVVPDRHNFRFSVGPVNAILNWEQGDQNHFRYGENSPRPKITQPSALVPGRAHTIEVRQDGDNVSVLVDGKQHFATPGSLEGTVTIYAASSEIMVRELIIVGEPDLLRNVTGPSHKNLN